MPAGPQQVIDYYVNLRSAQGGGDVLFPDFFPRFNTAYNFYESAGVPKNQINSHLNGIDFGRAVALVPIPPPELVQQLQVPPVGNNPVYQGQYYSVFGVAPTELGINPKGKQFDPVQNKTLDAVVEKKPNAYDVVPTDPQAPKTIVLKSTAAAITDTWSDKDHPFHAKGGGEQMFCPVKNAFKFNRRKSIEIQMGPSLEEIAKANAVADAKVNASAGADAKVNANVGADAKVNAGADAKVNSNASVNASSSSSATSSATSSSSPTTPSIPLPRGTIHRAPADSFSQVQASAIANKPVTAAPTTPEPEPAPSAPRMGGGPR